MNKILIFSWLTLALIFTGQINAQEQRVIKDVVLLNIEPYEVLMTESGNIITKVRHLPNYLKTHDVVRRQKVDTKIVPKSQKAKEDQLIAKNDRVIVEPEVKVNELTSVQVPLRTYKDHYEVNFARGTATLSGEAISILNELAEVLKADPSQNIQVFGFQNESPMVASLLSKRRQDACIAYLSIKGVAVRKQISKGSVTPGTNNKIVFGFE